MNTKLEPGLIITIVAALLFYLRVAMLRGRKRRLAREEMAAVMSLPKGKQQKERIAQMEAQKNQPPVAIRSWLLAGICILLMLSGILFKNYPGLNLPQILVAYWWVGPTAGFLLFMAAIK
jgi:hypothetical protein